MKILEPQDIRVVEDLGGSVVLNGAENLCIQVPASVAPDRIAEIGYRVASATFSMSSKHAFRITREGDNVEIKVYL